eukprot:6695940-Lingulodinium_polyedra.AAC.1
MAGRGLSTRCWERSSATPTAGVCARTLGPPTSWPCAAWRSWAVGTPWPHPAGPLLAKAGEPPLLATAELV